VAIFGHSERAHGSVRVLVGPRGAGWWLPPDDAEHVVSSKCEPEEVVWGCGVAFDQVGRAIGPGLVTHGTREGQLQGGGKKNKFAHEVEKKLFWDFRTPPPLPPA